MFDSTTVPSRSNTAITSVRSGSAFGAARPAGGGLRPREKTRISCVIAGTCTRCMKSFQSIRVTSKPSVGRSAGIRAFSARVFRSSKISSVPTYAR